jgi:FG-GAP-like repeat
MLAQIGDYNGDGVSDILWIDNSGNVALWLMSGGQIFSTAGLGNVGTTWSVQAQNAE